VPSARALEKSHGKYNESFVRIDSEELLLNIVHLHDDQLAEVGVSAFAAQAEGRPFFGAPNPAGSTLRRRDKRILPTLSLTPIPCGETVARDMRPVTLDGLIVFAETSWPISTIFRLWVEGANGLPNAPSASGPTRGSPLEYQEFLRAAQLWPLIQDRGELIFRKVEEDVLGDSIALDRVTGADLVEARKVGEEYRQTPDGKSCWNRTGGWTTGGPMGCSPSRRCARGSGQSAQRSRCPTAGTGSPSRTRTTPRRVRSPCSASPAGWTSGPGLDRRTSAGPTLTCPIGR
jgi:hypothetical protein